MGQWECDADPYAPPIRPIGQQQVGTMPSRHRLHDGEAQSTAFQFGMPGTAEEAIKDLISFAFWNSRAIVLDL